MPTIKSSVPKRTSSPTVTFLTQDELKRLVSTIKDKRDRAIILMAYRHGLHASEIGLLRGSPAFVQKISWQQRVVSGNH